MENASTVYSICRLCLSENRVLGSILEHSNLVQKILTCLNIEVKETDRISTMICKQCVQKVDEWFEFKNSCDDAQLKLHILVNNAFQDNAEMPTIVKEEINIFDEHEQIYIPSISCVKNEPLDIYDSEIDEDNKEFYFSGFSNQNASELTEQGDSLLIPSVESYYGQDHMMEENMYNNLINEYPRLTSNSNTMVASTSKIIASSYNTTGKRSNRCRICYKKFSTVNNCTRHEQNVHFSRGEFPPTPINIILEHEFILYHANMIRQIKAKTCDCCNKYFKSVTAIIVHLGCVNRYTCYYCCLTFKNRSNYSEHRSQKVCLERIKLLQQTNCTFKSYQHYTCLKCNNIYTTEMCLPVHIMKKHLPKQFPTSCEGCGFELYDAVQFQNHVENSPCIYNIYCSICKTSFPNRFEFDCHCNIHGDGQTDRLMDYSVLLQHCEAEYEQENGKPLDTFINPFTQHEELDVYKSSEVEFTTGANTNEIFKQNEFVLMYKQIHRMLQTSICDCCNKKFVSSSGLIGHLRNRFTIDAFTCFLCCVTFPNRSQFMKHKKRQVCTRREEWLQEPNCPFKVYEHYTCVKCDCLHVFKNSMLNHVMKKHSPGIYPANCTECGTMLFSSQEFLQHNEINLCLFNIFCSICRINFRNTVDFQQHTMVHDNSTDTSNQNIPFQFVQYEDDSQSEPEEELQVINPYSEARVNNSTNCMCQICGKRYSTYHNLKRHLMAMHTKYNYVLCKCCFGVFLTENQLIHHFSIAHMYGNKKYNFMQDKNVYNFNCTKCSARFSKIGQFDAHLSKHATPKHSQRIKPQKITCAKCKAVFTNNNELANHNCKHFNLKMKLYRCADSPNSYRAIPNFSPKAPQIKGEVKPSLHKAGSSHMNGKMLDGTFKCPLCPKVYLSKGSLSKHNQKTHLKNVKKLKKSTMATSSLISKSSLSCKVCKNIYLSRTSLNQHYKIKHSSETTDISSNYKDYKKYFAVLGPGTGNQSYKCKICNKVVTHQKTLVAHYTFHLRKTMCSICKTITANKHSLLVHMKQVHIKPEKSLLCHSCNKRFLNGTGLKNHLRMIHGIRSDENHKNSFQCMMCEKVFAFKGGLVRHARKKHPTEMDVAVPQTFRCNYCKKKFLSSRALKLHVNYCAPKHNKIVKIPVVKIKKETETVNKVDCQVICNICMKKFGHKGLLKNHLKSHFRNNDENKCRACHGVFTSLESFVEHIDSCEGYSCVTCGKTFETISSLNGHLAKHARINNKLKNAKKKKNSLLVSKKKQTKPKHKCAARCSKMCILNNKVSQFGAQKIKVKHVSNNIVKTEAIERLYKCTQCDITFTSAKNLRLHVMAHIL